MTSRAAHANAGILCALAASIMAYGWGYRGIVGHEGGAMVPGALLGLAICLASGREDWYRRAAVAGLFGAAGWAWGGSISYMEQTFYTVTDSFPDVLYGYAVLFFMGGLWAGIGGAVLGLAFTLPRSALQRLAGPFAAIGAVYLALYLYLFFDHTTRDTWNRLSAQHFHDGDFLAALIALVTCGLYALVRKQERGEALLYCAVCLAWFAGYLGLTWIGGIQLAPPYRNEGWGGVLGILVALIVYLRKTENRAALLLACYGMLGGGLAFAAAVFFRHPVRVEWGPFASWGGMMQWKIAEESFGLLMGLAIALGALRLLRGGLAPAGEDAPRKPLDIFAVFVVIVALLWMNVRRGPERWIYRYNLMSSEPAAGLPPWLWLAIAGIVMSGLALYALRLYQRDALAIAPPTAFGKGQWVLLFLLWSTVATGFAQQLPEAGSRGYPLVEMSFILFAAAATALLLFLGNPAPAVSPGDVPPSDTRWKPGKGFYAACAGAPVMLVVISLLSIAMQEGPAAGARLRFGPEAYWREAAAVMGTWKVSGLSASPGAAPEQPAPETIRTIEFLRDRSAVVTSAAGDRIADAHRWFHADSRIHLDWYGRLPEHEDKETLVMELSDGRLYVPWPPAGARVGYLVLERAP